MRVIVIPDVHQRTTEVENVLSQEPGADKYVFLGDWFDSFYEKPKVSSFTETCQFLKYLIFEHPLKDKFVFLLGNHDISYIYNNNKDYNRAWNKTPRFYCSGITGSKVSAFRKEFYSKNLRDKFFIEYFKPCIRIDGVTYSHAGISTHHFPYGYNIERFIELANEVWREFRNECHPHYHILAGVGTSRGGRDTVGGVLWQDWRYDFFASYDIGKQIVGHTIVPGPDVAAEGTPYESWNIDTNSNHYAVVTDGNIQIKENYLWKNLAISHRTVRHDF